MKKRIINIAIVMMLIIGIGLMLYPSLSNFYNSFHQGYAIADYNGSSSKIDISVKEAMLSKASNYNSRLERSDARWILNDEQFEEYNSLLDVTGTGIMGYIEIPKIKVTLPIYHGTNDDVLQTSIGHIPGSSLPVGGIGTHCVLSGHRGLPSAKLFTDIDELVIGDNFMIHVFDETLAYEVDQIRVVLPDEIDDLAIDENNDYCTLVTCTPYGVNSHRLLVRGRRVDVAEEVKINPDMLQIEPFKVFIVLMIPIMVVMLIVFIITGRRRES